MKDFYQAFVFVDTVINHNRTVQQFSHVRPLSHNHTDAWKASEQIDVIQ